MRVVRANRHNTTRLKEFLDPKDISIVALLDGKEIGTLWCGLMNNGTLGYVDNYWVDPEHRNSGVGAKLARQLVKVCQKKGVKVIFGMIGEHEYKAYSQKNALNSAMQAHPTPFTGVYGEIKTMAKQLGVEVK